VRGLGLGTEVPQWGPGAEPAPIGGLGDEVPQKLKNFTVIVGEFLHILGVTTKQFTSVDLEVCIEILHACGLYFWSPYRDPMILYSVKLKQSNKT